MTNTDSIKKMFNAVLAALEEGKEFDDCEAFVCNNGPSLKQASDVIGKFPPNQSVWCSFQIFENGQKVPLVILGLLPLDFSGDEKGRYVMLVEVAAQDECKNTFWVAKDGRLHIEAGEFYVGFGRFHTRNFRFWRIKP